MPVTITSIKKSSGNCKIFGNYSGRFLLAPPPAEWGEESWGTPHLAKGPYRPLGTPCCIVKMLRRYVKHFCSSAHPRTWASQIVSPCISNVTF